MNPEIMVAQASPKGGEGSPRVGLGDTRAAVRTESHDVQKGSSPEKTDLTAQAISVADRISISEKGRVKEAEKKEKDVVEERNARAFEPSAIRNNTVAFKKTETNQLIMQILDKETNKVLKEYPPEELQRVSQALHNFLESHAPKNGEQVDGVA